MVKKLYCIVVFSLISPWCFASHNYHAWIELDTNTQDRRIFAVLARRPQDFQNGHAVIEHLVIPGAGEELPSVFFPIVFQKGLNESQISTIQDLYKSSCQQRNGAVYSTVQDAFEALDKLLGKE